MIHSFEKSVLLLDDQVDFLRSLSKDFTHNNYKVTAVTCIKDIPNQSFDEAVLDIRLVGESGLDAITLLKKNNPQIRIVMLSGYGSIATCVEALRRGALNYLIKPVRFKALQSALAGDMKDTHTEELQVPTLSEFEHEYIDFVLQKNEGNITHTAKELGLHRQSLQRKLKKLK